MLPEKYNPELTPARNYFGDGFDSDLEKQAGGIANISTADIEIALIVQKHELGVVHALMFRRQIETSFMSSGAKAPGAVTD